MPRNNSLDLRNHLFAALEDLNDLEGDLDAAIERAKAVTGIARELNSLAKNELKYLDICQRNGKMPDTGQHAHLLGPGKVEEQKLTNP